jgi:hypothetical protein
VTGARADHEQHDGQKTPSLDDYEALRARLVDQGWGQGAIVPWVGGIAAAIARQGLPLGADTIDDGHPAGPGEKSDGGLVLISQTCDLVAPPQKEPFAVAIPFGRWGKDRNLPQPNSSRDLVVDHEKRLVLAQSRLVQFDKRRLPNEVAERVEVHPAVLGAWCARRWRRTPLPDTLAAVVVPELANAIRRIGDRRGALAATKCWRADLRAWPKVTLIGVYYTGRISSDEFAGYVHDVDGRIRERLSGKDPKVAQQFAQPEESLGTTLAFGWHELSLEDAARFPMISFDYLSVGVDPDDEEASLAFGELLEEDLL